MRTTLKWVCASMAAALLAGMAMTTHAQRAEARGGPGIRDSVLRIPANAAFPLSKRIDLGVGRSIVVQFPVPLKDVLVSDPQLMDAVVQSSDRVFLIAKKSGQTNAFFFDEYGQQILTLEVAVGADLSALDQLLARLIPGSNIHSELAGKAIILTGSVRTPINSDRAAQIAAQFSASYAGTIGTVGSSNQSNTSNDHDEYAEQHQRGRPHLGLQFADPGRYHDIVRRRRSLRRQAGHQPARGGGRGAGHAPRHRGRGAALDAEAVRHQHRRAAQLGQLHLVGPQRQRLPADVGGGSGVAANGRHPEWCIVALQRGSRQRPTVPPRRLATPASAACGSRVSRPLPELCGRWSATAC